MRWDDLRFFLATVRAESVRGAALELAVSHSTIARRIEDFEARLGARLFDRTPTGFVITEAGTRLIPHAEAMERAAADAERQLLGEDRRLDGEVRLTLPYSIVEGLLMDDLARFAERYPRVQLELSISDALLDISRREADIALRFLRTGHAPPAHLIGRQVGLSCHAAYASPAYLDAHTLDGDAPTARWLGWEERTARPDWLAESPLPGLGAVHRFDDVSLQLDAARCGMGIAFLPCAVGDRSTDVVRVPGTVPVPRFDIWILSHPDLRDTTRLRAMRDWLADAMERRAALFRGEGTSTDGG